jgi:hypothetical protein
LELAKEKATEMAKVTVMEMVALRQTAVSYVTLLQD